MLKLLGFVFVFCCFSVDIMRADELDSAKDDYNEILNQCMKEIPLTAEDIDAMANDRETPNINCIFACALKRSGMMDDDGNLSVEGVQKSAEKYISDDPELLKKSQMFTDACKSVNDAPVSDGKKGCDRAALIYKCSVKRAANFKLL